MKTVLIIIGGVLLSVILLIGFLLYKEKSEFAHFEIKGIAMTPSYTDGQIFRADNKIYSNQSPKRGDVIVYISPKDKKTFFAKRIIGLPVESLEIKEGKVYINGQLLEEPYLEKSAYTGAETFLSERKKVMIPEGTYFVMGDNRIHSSDSREWGFLSKENIFAKLTTCFTKCSEFK